MLEIWARLLPGSIIVQGQLIGKHRARGNSRILVHPCIGFLGHDCLRLNFGPFEVFFQLRTINNYSGTTRKCLKI